MCDITNEVTVRLGLGQRALEDSRERAIRGSIVGKLPSDLRRLGLSIESLAPLPLSRFYPPAKLLSDHVLVFQQLCFVSPRRSVCPGAIQSPGIASRDGQPGILGGYPAICQLGHHYPQ